jgi:SAM-dependent methyltransferase
MNDNDRISAYYLGRLGRHEATHEALGWESAAAQRARFAVLLDVTPEERYSLVDVGSGLGDLYAFLRETSEPVDYTGVDILPQMVDRARQRFPSARFECLDVLSDTAWSETFDVVFASGIFNLRAPDNAAFVARAASRFREIAKRLCVANFLSDSSPDKEDPYFYYSRDTVKSVFSDFFGSVKVVDGYLENDFTVVSAVDS